MYPSYSSGATHCFVLDLFVKFARFQVAKRRSAKYALLYIYGVMCCKVTNSKSNYPNFSFGKFNDLRFLHFVLESTLLLRTKKFINFADAINSLWAGNDNLESLARLPPRE